MSDISLRAETVGFGEFDGEFRVFAELADFFCGYWESADGVGFFPGGFDGGVRFAGVAEAGGVGGFEEGAVGLDAEGWDVKFFEDGSCLFSVAA